MTELQLDVEQPDLVIRVLEGSSADFEQVRRFRQLTDRAQACGLLVPAHRYVVKLDPPHLQVPTERVEGCLLEQAIRRGEVFASALAEPVMALLRMGREVFTHGGDLLADAQLSQFMHGSTPTGGPGIYFVGLDPVFVTWDRDFGNPARGGAYARLVATAADLMLEIETVAQTSLSTCRVAALALCAQIEDEDPDQPWTGQLRDAIVEGRPSNWRSWS